MAETVLRFHLPLGQSSNLMSKLTSRTTAPFAVIELIAILAIVGILVSILAPTFTRRAEPAGTGTTRGNAADQTPARP